MSTEVRLPPVGFSTQESQLIAFLVPDGAAVTKGQPLFALELEKSVQEIEAVASGTLKIIAEVGKSYPVGELIAEIL